MRLHKKKENESFVPEELRTGFFLYILGGINHPSSVYYGEKLLFSKKRYGTCAQLASLSSSSFSFFYEDKL